MPNRNRQNSFHFEIHLVDFHTDTHTNGNNTTKLFDDMRAPYFQFKTKANQSRNCLFFPENIIVETKKKKKKETQDFGIDVDTVLAH